MVDIELRAKEDSVLEAYDDYMTDGEFLEWAETAKLEPIIECLLNLRDRKAAINREAKDKIAPLDERNDMLKSIMARKMMEQGEDTKSVTGVGSLRLTQDTKYNADDWEMVYQTEAKYNERFTRQQLVASKVESFLADKDLDPEACGFSTYTNNTVVVSKARAKKER